MAPSKVPQCMWPIAGYAEESPINLLRLISQCTIQMNISAAPFLFSWMSVPVSLVHQKPLPPLEERKMTFGKLEKITTRGITFSPLGIWIEFLLPYTISFTQSELNCSQKKAKHERNQTAGDFQDTITPPPSTSCLSSQILIHKMT